ncbi:MAG: type IV secretion system DNA-binding domain-containing protein [Symploca sp. SIO2E6]|nr:type IV secretion system DNA-binding domain-containing protein [Symploca sp. SIO2E6]
MEWFGKSLAKLGHKELVGVLLAEIVFLVAAFGITHYLIETAGLEWWQFWLRLIPLVVGYGFFELITGIVLHLKENTRLRGDSFILYLYKTVRRVSVLWIAPPLFGIIFYYLILKQFNHGLLAATFGFIAAFICFYLADRAFPVETQEGERKIVQGGQLLSYEEASSRSEEVTKNKQFRVLLGGIWLPLEALFSHVLIMGAPGSGKTLLIRGFIKHLFQWIGKGYQQKAFVYSNKNQDLSYLSALRLTGEIDCSIVILTPGDVRAVKPDLASSVTDEAMALALARSLVPSDPQSKQPYFARTAQIVLSGLIQALMELYPGTWGLRHLLLVSESAERIRQVLEKVPYTKRYIEQHAKEGKAEDTLQNVISELGGKLEPYRPLAALWEKAESTLDLEDWVMHQESILYCGYDEKRPEVSALAIRIYVNLLAMFILDLPDNFDREKTRHRMFAFLLDEFPSLERVDALLPLLSRGRDRGVVGVLTAQAWSQIRKVWGEDDGNSIMGQISNKLFLRVEDDVSEAKILKLFGSHKKHETSVSRQHSAHGISLGERDAIKDSPLISSSELWNIPPPSAEYGIQGFGRTPWVGRYRLVAPFEIPPRDPNQLNYARRDNADMRLADFDKSEKSHLGITEKNKPKGQRNSAALEVTLPQRQDREERSPSVQREKRRAKEVNLRLIGAKVD